MSGVMITKGERDALVLRVRDFEARKYPPDRSKWPEGSEWDRLVEGQLQALAEYSDRLPRMVLSRCPHCDSPLKRSFDPFGFDGPWWIVDPTVQFEEPRHCGHFQCLLGAVDLHGREPKEVEEEVRPGPDAPFVVPALLELPRMVAVVGKTRLATGDTAYPIAYFSTERIDPALLHQPWCRNELWFTDEAGNSCFTISNDAYDFDLLPYLKDGRLRWVDLDVPELSLSPPQSDTCPFIHLPGDRQRQMLSGGKRTLIGLPTGEPINPFE